MPYATYEELAARIAAEMLIALADDDGDGVPDAGAIDAALTDADAEIDARLGGRYVTPLDPAPGIVRRWCVDLAVARLYQRRRETMPPEVADAAGLARRAMDAIAVGAARLAGPSERSDGLRIGYTGPGQRPVWGDDELSNY